MTSRVRLTILPSGRDEDVTASDFLKQVSALRDLIMLSAHASSDLEARVVDLSHSSPATIELQATWRSNRQPLNVDSYFGSVRSVVEDGAAPRELGRPVFDALKEFVSVIGKGVSRATLQIGSQKIEIEQQARQRVEAVIEPDYTIEGEADGMLEAVSVHGKRNQFVLYPIIGPSRVNCYFSEEMLDRVKPALGRYVIVKGQLKYRWRDRFPTECRAGDIEILDEADQPEIRDILAFAPDATGGKASEDFVREIRGGWR